MHGSASTVSLAECGKLIRYELFVRTGGKEIFSNFNL